MLLPVALLAALHLPPTADSLPGTWKITMEAAGNVGEETCTLKQSGAAITGTCIGMVGQTIPVTGELKDGTFTFKHANNRDGQEMTLVFTGTVVSATALKGTLDVQPLGISGTFTATPAPANAPAKP